MLNRRMLNDLLFPYPAMIAVDLFHSLVRVELILGVACRRVSRTSGLMKSLTLGVLFGFLRAGFAEG